MRKSLRPRSKWAVLPAVVLLVAACGSSSTPPPTAAPASAAPASAAPASAGPVGSPAALNYGHYSGVTINVATFTGPPIATPLAQAASQWENLTGGRINLTEFPFSDLYQKEITDAASGTNAFTVYTMASSWMGDFARAGYAMDLTNLAPNYPGIQWNDILPFYRNVSALYNGKIYGIPFDGDMLFVYYRSDLFAKYNMQPPKTWDEYLSDAKFFNGKPLGPGGSALYGSCNEMARGGVGTWLFNGVLASYTQSLGTSQGAFFGDNMTPLVNSAAMQAALTFWKATLQYGPPNQQNLDQATGRGLMAGGRCALNIDWADMGVLQLDPTISKTQNEIGTAILPGSTQVLDRSTGKLVPCSATTCPYAIDGVNHAPFAAFGGWTGVINAKADPQAQQAALSFLAYVSAPGFSNWEVTQGISGMNPFRTSQTTDLDVWEKAGMTSAVAQNYLSAVQQSLSSPNVALDLRIAQANQYTNTIEDQAISQYLAGQLSVQAAMQQIYNGWQQLTDQIGRSQQAAAYAASLGVQK